MSQKASILTDEDMPVLVESGRTGDESAIALELMFIGLRSEDLKHLVLDRQGSILLTVDGVMTEIRIPEKLREELLKYAERHQIQEGPLLSECVQ